MAPSLQFDLDLEELADRAIGDGKDVFWRGR
jgi:hypothetical protein